MGFSFFEDIVVTPHCDMHVAMTGTPPAKITVFERWTKKDPSFPNGEDLGSYELKDVTSSCDFNVFAPYEAPGARLQAFFSIDADGNITPASPGINFIQITHKDIHNREHYMIVRLQVHQQILGWWFGNSSLTVPKDDRCAHTQVSIYALFSDDAKKTDLVGDITGHGYVNLASSNNAVFEPDANKSGRLWGKTTGIAAALGGSFLGSTKSIPVKVVDYKQQRNILDPLRYTKPFKEALNILFIGDGFLDSGDDRKRFDKVVTKAVDDLFNKPRHAPYNILQGSFNVFKVFQPSEQRVITQSCGINDEEDPALTKGLQVPYSSRLSSSIDNAYSPEELIRKVGLPLRNETRSWTVLKKLWTDYFLDFDPARVDENLVNVWKKQRSTGILETKDTFFGMCYGRRYADQLSRVSSTALTIPGSDTDTAELRAFVKRLYEWFYTEPTRTISPDTRRHPPEVHKDNESNTSNIVMQFLKSLHYIYDPSQHIGLEWEPDVNGGTYKPSVGFVAMIINDGIAGGANVNSSTFTTTSLSKGQVLGFKYDNTPTEKVMRRNPPDDLPFEVDAVINTIAHEFGHSFNLGDEYEDFSADSEMGEVYDNITSITTIQLDAAYKTNRKIIADKVKWFDLPRIELSARLNEDSSQDGSNLKVKIDPRQAGRWSEAKKKNKTVNIRKPENKKKLLPLPAGDANYITALDILSVDASSGIVVLGGINLPAAIPIFPKGSFIFIPLRDKDGNLIFVVEKKVLEFLKNDPVNKNLPLNSDNNATTFSKAIDYPKDIPGFSPACCDSEKTIGVYEGANQYSGFQYRPAGNCKMRKSQAGSDGEFCHVCKYLIVSRVDPQLHDLLDKEYYPVAKSS